MPELRRLGIAAADPRRLAAFYQEVFELENIGEEKGTIVLSDGTFNLALAAAGDSDPRGFRYIGFQTARIESMEKRFAANEKALLIADSDLGPEIEHEIRDPDGNLVGLCKRAFDVSFSKGPVPIRRIALYTPDPQRLADFYSSVLGMKEVDRTDRSSIFVSDGYFNLALLYQRSEERLGLNHFGFHVESNEELRERAKKAGVSQGARRPERIPFAEYRVHDPEGNGIDISEKGWKC
jgi:catechol 2,3-dioxygenase-like lactoylglutathione lyase family enzyme